MPRPTGPRPDYRAAASGGAGAHPPKPPQQPRSAEPEEPARRSRLVPLLLGVAALVIVGALATYFITNGSKPSSTKTTPATSAPTTVATPTTTPTQTKTTPSVAPVLGVWALTGMPRTTQEVPALCIKIENSVEARPQIGLDTADIVYEEVVEGGITRFMAVFQSNTPKSVEPVRSLRPMDVNLALPIGCPLVFSGGQVPFVDAAAATGIQLIYMDRGDPGFSRDSGRAAPHNVIGDTATFVSQVKGTPTVTPAFKYAAAAGQSSAATGGKATKTISAKMSSSSNPQWQWDATKSVWLRSEGTKPAVVMSGAQMSAANVVFLSVQVQNTKFRDPIGTPVPESIVIGSGSGWVASEGKSETIKWSKASASAPFVLTDSKGAPVTLAIGNTWVELVPTSGSVTTS